MPGLMRPRLWLGRAKEARPTSGFSPVKLSYILRELLQKSVGLYGVLPERGGTRMRDAQPQSSSSGRAGAVAGARWNPSALTRVVAESAEHNPHAEPALGDRRLNERADERVLGELLEREIEVATLSKRHGMLRVRVRWGSDGKYRRVGVLDREDGMRVAAAEEVADGD